MKNHHSNRKSGHFTSTAKRAWWATPVACLATLLALPVNAGFVIPDSPLTMANRVAPNILFILDDSGSMAFNYMPDNVPGTSTVDISSQAYTRNTLYYNPAVTYLPWVQANGSRMTGGTSYSAVYGSFNLVGGNVINLGDASSCRKYNYNTGSSSGPSSDETTNGTDVCGGVQTFYVPKDVANTTGAYLGDGRNYYRYQILANGSDIQRGEWGSVTRSANQTVKIDGNNVDSGSLDNGNAEDNRTDDLEANASLVITINNTSSGGNSRDLNYWVYDSSGQQVCNGKISRGSSNTCDVTSTLAGKYKITVQRDDNRTTTYQLSAVKSTTNSCGSERSGSAWINCSSSLPNTSRTLAAELSNYATWFSYHRTRIKAAKAGAAEAFMPLGNKVRVGLRTIWNRNNLNIPVADGNDGRFVDTPDDPGMAGDQSINSRSAWYSRLFSVIGYNGTPLHSALDSAGQYFSDSSSTGPYGPESGSNQYACRQNFAILTTDGYWNNKADSVVGEQDNAAGNAIRGPNSQSYAYAPVAPYKSSDSDTLADVAMKYWKNDLRDLENIVPTSVMDPAFWQHMTTFGISIGLAGTSGWRSVADVPANATWRNPNDVEDSDRIDDLLHAAVNGRGAFVSASNPSEFSAGLSSALEAISERTSSYSNVAANSVSLNAGTQVFNASYVSGSWTGSLVARAVDDNGVSDTLTWAASIPAWASRKIFTSSGSSGAVFPTTTQTASLARSGGPVDYPVTGAKNADYIKGDQSLQGSGSGQLRIRTSLLGDIIGSSPAYVKDTNTLYVGANDGMMHAFNAATGAELFGYVPGIINMTSLASLSRGDYSHKFLVDGPIAVSNRMLTPGKNLLVGTLGRGGKGLYSLDVSTPATPAASMFKWERAETTGNNMGLVLGKPLLARTKDGNTSVVFGNGINSSREKAVLIVLDIETGNVIREIDTGAGSATAPNGLSAVAGVYGADGKSLAYVYAGDMLGNVWKFDLTSTSPLSWNATRLFTTSTGQPITAAIAVATDPTTFKRWIFFGTGSFLTPSDANTAAAVTQSMYGIIDEGVAVPKTSLTRRTIWVTSATVNGYPVRAFQSYAALPSTSKGWYVDLPEAGERIVQDAQVASNFLVTASMTPLGGGCGADGSGYINAVDAFTGTSGRGSYFDLDGDGSTDDNAVTGNLPVGSVNVGNGMPTLPNLLRGRIVAGGTGGNGVGGPKTRQPVWLRMSWRELRKD